VFQYYKVGFIPCHKTTPDGEPCADQQEIEKFVTKKAFQFLLLDYYLDIEDYQQIVKAYINDQVYVSFDWAKENQLNLFMRPGEIVDGTSRQTVD